MPDYENVLYQQDGPVVTITWNRPETLNAITRPWRMSSTSRSTRPTPTPRRGRSS